MPILMPEDRGNQSQDHTQSILQSQIISSQVPAPQARVHSQDRRPQVPLPTYQALPLLITSCVQTVCLHVTISGIHVRQAGGIPSYQASILSHKKNI